ncbi:hypothetical protein C2845_PM15G03740 [Panicum miliaceum]|uniref:USP domain-containing protein n=1 Tax=Panicum miliaceum TaxID=4540 RepID=A0A3L6Q9H5_PANMI|nr:hypothetical protein C2845_PM15G03740 [Panicum miliaceum]
MLPLDEKEAWEGLHIAVDSTVVYSVFAGQCSITKSCSECSSCSFEDEEFLYLPVQVPSRSHSAVVPLTNNCAQFAEGTDDEMGEKDPKVNEAVGGCNEGQDNVKKQKDDEMKVMESNPVKEDMEVIKKAKTKDKQVEVAEKEMHCMERVPDQIESSPELMVETPLHLVDGKKAKRNAMKKILMARAPPVLVVALKRFKFARGTTKKLTEHVHFKEVFGMRPFIEQSSMDINTLYRLVGVVEHIGGMEGGHYVAYVRATKMGS